MDGETLIADLDLSDYAAQALNNHGIETLGELQEFGRENLSSLKGVGPKTIQEISKYFNDGGVVNEDDIPEEWEEDTDEPEDEAESNKGEGATEKSPANNTVEQSESKVQEDVQATKRGVEAAFEEKRREENESLANSIMDNEEDAQKIVNQIVKHTKKVRMAMDTEPIDLNLIANENVELGILLQRLAERVVTAGYNERSAEYNYKTVKESLKTFFVEIHGNTASLADSKKEAAAREEFELWNEAKQVADNLSMIYRSTNKTLDQTRSKLSFGKGAEHYG